MLGDLCEKALGCNFGGLCVRIGVQVCGGSGDDFAIIVPNPQPGAQPGPCCVVSLGEGLRHFCPQRPSVSDSERGPSRGAPAPLHQWLWRRGLSGELGCRLT